MLLTELDPCWIDIRSRRRLGLLWRCYTGHCGGLNATLFSNPLDGLPAFEGDSWRLLDELLKTEGLIDYGPDGLRQLVRGCGLNRWTRVDGEGKPKVGTDTFASLTLVPSVNAYECGHFEIKEGKIV